MITISGRSPTHPSRNGRMTPRLEHSMMGNEEHQHLQRQIAVFMPYAAGRIAALKAANKRLAHYSSAKNVMNIIKSKTFWLRNTRCMADYSEIDLGYGMLHKFFQQQTNRDAFYKAVKRVQS